MSHLSVIRTQIKNPIVLQQVIEKMIESGLDGILTGAYLETNTQIHDLSATAN